MGFEFGSSGCRTASASILKMFWDSGSGTPGFGLQISIFFQSNAIIYYRGRTVSACIVHRRASRSKKVITFSSRPPNDSFPYTNRVAGPSMPWGGVHRVFTTRHGPFKPLLPILEILKRGFIQSHYTFTSILRIKIAVSSKLPSTEFKHYECFVVKFGV